MVYMFVMFVYMFVVCDCVSVCVRLEFLEMFGFISNKNSCYLSYC